MGMIERYEARQNRYVKDNKVSLQYLRGDLEIKENIERKAIKLKYHKLIKLLNNVEGVKTE